MSASVEWKIESMAWDAETGGVTTAHWRASATQDGEYVDAYGSVGFSPDPDSDTFIEIGDLTPEQVIDWVKNSSEEMTEIEDNLIRQLNKRLNPTTLTGLPWAADA